MTVIGEVQQGDQLASCDVSSQVSGAVLHFASESGSDTVGSGSLPETGYGGDDHELITVDRWAIQGPHQGWLGFDHKTGEPKSRR